MRLARALIDFRDGKEKETATAAALLLARFLIESHEQARHLIGLVKALTK